MRETSRINLRLHHSLFYGTRDVISSIRSNAPLEWDGLRDLRREWVGANWDVLVLRRCPTALQHVLRPPFVVGTWEETLMYLLAPGAHVKNEGWASWAKVASVLAGFTYKEKYVFRH